MQDLEGKVAVVTGAASGIGRGLAEAFAAEGMRLVLADVEANALDSAAAALRARGVEVHPVVTDVAVAADVDRLADHAWAACGAVHVVCNNAGVAVSGLAWEQTVADWQWILGVNLWGVIHGIRAFVPRMLAQGTEGHVVNTASLAGLTSNPFMAAYNVTKHGVVTLSETLEKELRLTNAKLRVSVLCPGFVKTGIADSDRNRPAALREPEGTRRASELDGVVRNAIETGTSPTDVARQVVEAIRAERFYVVTHPELLPFVRARCDDVVEGRNPRLEPVFR
jgi:NAD(P)-dependent dehydrogenase (short-subunit alcohol dehydrogenase family)